MIPQETQARLDHYVDAFEHTKQRVSNDQVATAIVQELARDGRASQHRLRDQSGSQPATLKQIEYLKKLGAPIRPELTKAEASALIDQALGRE